MADIVDRDILADVKIEIPAKGGQHRNWRTFGVSSVVLK
jgi:hypothetical protein